MDGIRSIWENEWLIIEAVSIDSIRSLADKRYNSLNHWDRPDDYEEMMALGETHRWVSHFRDGFYVIDIEPVDIDWMLRAERIGCITGRFSKLHSEELERMVHKYAPITDHLFDAAICGPGWFVRTEKVSLKFGCHGVGPYTNMRSIIESMTTSISCHSPLKPSSSQGVRIFPWMQLNPWKEFRVFVHDHRIRCISQQDIYGVNEILHQLDSDHERIDTIIGWARELHRYHTDVIVPALHHIPSASLDLALVNDESRDRVLFIEPNSFGARMAAGSSLFHWIHDDDIMHNKKTLNTDQKIVFRYVEP
jgi:D123